MLATTETIAGLKAWHAVCSGSGGKEDGKMNLDLVEAAIEHICTSPSCGEGAVLVFLTVNEHLMLD